MTQRIFDIYNEKDYADLWDILPDDVFKITKQTYNDTHDLLWYNNGETSESPFGINWHDKTEITRPVDYEKMVGCVGWFWDDTVDCKIIGILTKYNEKREREPFLRNDGAYYCHFRPVKKSELKFWKKSDD